MTRKVSVLILSCLPFLSLRAADGPTFDVASIRAQAPGDTTFRVSLPANGQFRSQGAVAKLLLMVAYDIQEAQIVGGPAWISEEKWDIEARSTGEYSAEETRGMLQNTLEERFALRSHPETAQRPAYVLTIAKGGPKFKAGTDEGSTNVRTTRNSIALERGQLAQMTQLLSAALGRPVIDRTELNGRYDLSLQWDDAPGQQGALGLSETADGTNDRGSIFAAIQEQLGLRLEAQTVPVDVIVIDHIERPSPN